MLEITPNSQELGPTAKVTLKQLLGGYLLPRTDIQRPDIYQKLGEETISISRIETDEGLEILVQGLPVTGIDLNALLHYAAPSRVFGIDRGDLLMDWVDIYKPENTELLKRHVEKYIGVENWALFERVKDSVWSLIKVNSPTDALNPMIRLKKGADGKYDWNFNGDSMQVLGPALAAAFSPDITTKWPERIGQDMGTTQALPLTLMKREDLLGSVLIAQIIGFVETGQIPAIERPQIVSRASETKSAKPFLLSSDDNPFASLKKTVIMDPQTEKIYHDLAEFLKEKSSFTKKTEINPKPQLEIKSSLEKLFPKFLKDKKAKTFGFLDDIDFDDNDLFGGLFSKK